MEDAPKPKEPKMDKDEKEMLRAVGHALWRSELPAQATVEEKKSSWTDGRRKYVTRAKKLVRAFGKESITLTKVPKTREDTQAA